MKKRILSLLLTIVMMISLVPSLVYAQNDTDVERYTVLVLDTSGTQEFYWNNSLIYTADTAVSYVKQASTKFVNDVLNAKGNNKIAVVQYNSSASVVSEFSDDTTAINQKINALSSNNSNCCIAAGLEKANQLLSAITNVNVDKNIVLVTTGFTNSGQSNYSGHYNSSTIGSNWENMSTKIKLYAYANTAYATAEKVKESSTVYTLGLFQTMDNIPENGKNVAAFFKLTTMDLATSPSHFYEVDDPNNLEFTFGDIADRIINPLSITLGHSLINEMVTKKIDDVTTQYYDHYLYTIIAQVKNTANQTAKNVVCTFELPDEAIPFNEMISSTPQKVINIGDIAAGETKTISWDIEIKWPTNDISAIYGVHAKADNTVDMYQINIIYVPAKQRNDNAFVFGTDQWSFSNSTDNFDPNRTKTNQENYYMTDDDYNALVYNLSNTEKEAIDEWKASTWGGSCYGFSTTSTLTKMGVFKASEIQKERNSLYEVKKTSNNDSIESFINYYQMSWKLNPIQNICNAYINLSDNTQIQDIANKSDEVANGKAPIVVCFQWPKAGGAHAVVAYGHETGSWKFGGFLGFGATEYDSRILIYDCNYPDDKDGSCIYYNNGSGDIYIPNYASKNDAPDIYFACNSVEILDCKNYDVNTTNQKATLNAKNLTSYKLIINDVQYNISPEMNNEDLGIYSYYSPSDPMDASSLPEMTTILPDLNNDYYVILNDGDSGKLSLNYDNISLSADVNSADKIGFEPNGSVSLEGNEGDFKLSLVANEGYHTTPWYKTTISGTNTDTIEMSQNDDGIIIDGDNLDNLKITTKDTTQEKTQLIKTDEENILLTSDVMDNPIIMIDSDDDGTYDKQLETYTLTVNTTTGGEIVSEQIEKYSENAVVDIEAKAKAGYTFTGWTSSNGGTFEDANSLKTKFTMPANYTVITATFEKKSRPSGGGGLNFSSYTVKFETNGGSKIASKSINKNKTVAEPEAPIKEGYIFKGWYIDSELKTAYDFTSKVEKSITLYAAWEEDMSNKIILTIGENKASVFGEEKENDVAPKIVKDRTMLPIRFIAESLGAEVKWDEAERKVTITKGDIKIVITIDSDEATVNEKKVTLDSPAFIENDRTYLPIRFVSENLGAKVEWNESTQQVVITK